MPFHLLLAEVYDRYRRPLFIAETSHFGVGRGPWLTEVVDEVCRARATGVPLGGICIYPIIDRPDWDNLDHWHHSGLWELRRDREGRYLRVLDQEYASDLRRARLRLAADGCP